MLDTEIYTELRSKEQLGYLVGCMRKNTGGIYGMSFVIQSSSHDPRYCIDKILEFLDHFYHVSFTEELFDKYKDGVLSKLASGFDGLVDEADFLFSRVISFRINAISTPDWRAKENEYDQVKKLDYAKVKNVYKALFAPNADEGHILKRRKSTR